MADDQATSVNGLTDDPQARQRILDQVRRLSGDDHEVLEQFAHAALRRVPATILARADPDVAAAWLVDAFRWFDGWDGAGPVIRLLTPDVALDGHSDAGTIIEVASPDRPFTLSTITQTVTHAGFAVVRSIHPILGVERDASGKVVSIGPARDADVRESFVHVELDTALDGEAQVVLSTQLELGLRDVMRATGDHRAMRSAVQSLADRLRYEPPPTVDIDTAEETAALLQWLLDDNFVLLGWREYVIDHDGDEPTVAVVPDSGLGILVDTSSSRIAHPVTVASLPPEQQHRLLDHDLLRISRTNRLSTVHRMHRMDYVGVKWFDDDGRVIREYRLLGLITAAGYAEPSRSIPVLRQKLATILQREDVVPGSHDEATLVGLFQALPKDELFQTPVDTLQRTLVSLFEAEEHHRVRVLARVERFTRTVSVLVAVPKDDYSPELRRRLTRLLMTRYEASRVDVDLSLGDREDAVVRFSVHIDGEIPDVSIDALERDVHELARPWSEQVRAALVDVVGEADGLRLLRTVIARLPRTYRDLTAADIAKDDAIRLDVMANQRDPLAIWLQYVGDELHLKAAHRGPQLELSSFIPLLESLGLVVSGEVPYLLDGDGPQIALHDFVVRDARGGYLDIAAVGPRFSQAALAAFGGQCEIDALNRLVLSAGLTWRQVAILRAYRRYRRQVGIGYSTEYLNDAVCENPEAAAGIVELFEAKFDPHREASAHTIAATRDRVLALCDAIELLDQDRILRGMLALVDATSRTNAFRGDGLGKDAWGRDVPYLVLKFDPSRVPDVPAPVPHREIFVYSPVVEGVHLRGGPVARGGLRWSDRRDDTRTEVLGLMKAQMLKNAVIVPEGAKGGFVLKRPPSDPPELRADVERQYRTFVNALLDVTDNVVAGDVVTPANVRRYDGPDPYLVVAADKGTATFSDVANSIATERGFWLGDAFASGGSNGYDHKALGITARGAWVAISRHFRELGIDLQHDPVTVAGIGDMSGDVFGNGMLLSRSLRLVAAFDHRHVFLDPNPDPEASFAERERLYKEPRSSWDDYNPELISEGGGVYPRSLKRIDLSPQVRQTLRVEAESMSPPELISAILRAPVDLLYAGGIGTYVRGSGETNADIGDRANDEIRVEASELRARVVGEGANLAITQRGRIQYARRGGRIDQDAVHNAAGVDISDHEVNVKILLAMALESGRIDEEERHGLLAAVTDDVVAHVLRDVDLQTWQLSQEAARSATSLDRYRRLIADLEEEGVVNRTVDVLPSEEEFDERAAAGAGLTRPELATLVASSKRVLARIILQSSLPDEPAIAPVVHTYFPPLLVERFGDLIPHHRLRRELVATLVANDLVNRMGLGHVFLLSAETGHTRSEVIAAYWAAREVGDGDRWWRGVEDLGEVLDPERQLDLKARVDSLVEALMRIYLDDPLVPDVAAIIARDRRTFDDVRQRLSDLGTDAQRRGRIAQAQGLTDDLVTPDLADVLSSITVLTMVPDAAAVARDSGADAAGVVDAMVTVGDALGIDTLGMVLRRITPQGSWQRRQHHGLLADLRRLRRRAVETALADGPDSTSAGDALEQWLAANAPRVQQTLDLTRSVETIEPPSLDAVAVAVRAIEDRLGR